MAAGAVGLVLEEAFVVDGELAVGLMVSEGCDAHPLLLVSRERGRGRRERPFLRGILAMIVVAWVNPGS